MGPSRRPAWTEWSGWVYDETQNRYWRARQDAHGNLDYDYWIPDSTDRVGEAAPRGDVEGLTDSLSTVNLGGGQEAAYTQDSAYTYGATAIPQGSTTAYGASPTQSYVPYAAKSKGKPEPSSRHRSRAYKEKGKEKAFASKSSHRPKSGRGHADEYIDDPAVAAAAAASYNPDPFYTKPPATLDNSNPADEPVPVDPFYGASMGNFASGPSRSSGAEQTVDETDPPTQEEGEFEPSDQQQYRHPDQENHAQPAQEPYTHADQEYGGVNAQGDYSSRDTGRRDRRVGWDSGVPESSTGDPSFQRSTSSYYHSSSDDAPRDDPNDPLEAAISQADPYHTGIPGAAYASAYAQSNSTYPSESLYEDRSPTPRQDQYATPGPSTRVAPRITDDVQYSGPTSLRSSTSVGQEPDMLDGYVVEPSGRFRPGEIFKILWCEPLGAGPPRSEVITGYVAMQEDLDGRQFYQGFRRFIVVANDEGHCTCVPILTYGHKGCTKRGVKPSKHGVIYQLGKKPRLVDGEPELGFPPVRVDLYEKTEKLDKESRVNYSKLTTIEHNFRVFFIGRVVPEDFKKIVSPAVDICWNKKRRHNH
ncbi:hypothetical protein VTK26DRAFT_2141 [Humicola hyalothermophila]